ncbi:hypothetical protein SAMN05444272_3986 [Roseibium suaedae]|uniref:Uncharacterized protein n=1 Tax=Roseibium suaedae TaxID=735517 RepID=A0A1M7NUH7_9HYPH|nr:hypothetical protein SAMN05444272_3986 [Roseibium suaedae]
MRSILACCVPGRRDVLTYLFAEGRKQSLSSIPIRSGINECNALGLCCHALQQGQVDAETLGGFLAIEPAEDHLTGLAADL